MEHQMDAELPSNKGKGDFGSSGGAWQRRGSSAAARLSDYFCKEHAKRARFHRKKSFFHPKSLVH